MRHQRSFTHIEAGLTEAKLQLEKIEAQFSQRLQADAPALPGQGESSVASGVASSGLNRLDDYRRQEK